MEEQRYDYDGQLYPRSSFLEEYGQAQGAAIWNQAQRAEPPAAAKPPAAAAVEGIGHAARARHMQPIHVERGASIATPRATTRPRINIVWHKCTDLRLHDHEVTLESNPDQ